MDISSGMTHKKFTLVIEVFVNKDLHQLSMAYIVPHGHLRSGVGPQILGWVLLWDNFVMNKQQLR